LVRVIGQGVAMGWAGLGRGQGAPECRGGWEGERGDWREGLTWIFVQETQIYATGRSVHCQRSKVNLEYTVKCMTVAKKLSIPELETVNKTHTKDLLTGWYAP